MLLILAATTQVLLLSELLLRRILYALMRTARSSLRHHADSSVLASLGAAVLQAATIPLQVAGGFVSSLARSWGFLLVLFVLFTALLLMCSSSVYAFSTLSRMYNIGVAPFVGGLHWLFMLLDFVFRAVVPVWNGSTHLVAQLLRRVVLPYSFTNAEHVPELLQAVCIGLGSLGQSTVTWLSNVRQCTLAYEDTLRECAGNGTRGDCTSMFTVVDSRCFASVNHLSLDLLTPGLFFRQAAQSLQSMIGGSCGLAAIVLNLLMFPLADHHLYTAVHAGVNTVLFTAVGLPISTWRRCHALEGMLALNAVHRKIGCTPDWQPVGALAVTTLESFGNAVDSWLNAAAVLANERILGERGSCSRNVALKSIVLDAARAIEGLESIEALERLQGRNGLPESETLQSVRVVGLTPQLFGVTDGKSVLYRSAHDGYVLALGAWPLQVDVRFGLAAVSYGGSNMESDSTRDTRTGLLGCRCVDEPEFTLLCATAPYLQHIDDELAGLHARSMHRVVFPDVLLRGMTCANTAVRVMALRFPRRRLASTAGGGSGFDGYNSFSYSTIANRYTGDSDATDNLRLFAAQARAQASGAVEAAIFVQPVCGDNSITCAPTERDNCFPWCMGVVRGGRRAQNISMYNARRWEEHVLLPDVDCGVARDKGTCPAAENAPLVDMMQQTGVVRGRCAYECTPAPVPASVMSLVPLAAINSTVNSTLHGLKHNKAVWNAVRLQRQPFVVAGDVMLSTDEDAQRVIVTRIYDIGQSALQMGSERLTLTSNFQHVQVQTCATAADTVCVAQAMQQGRVVLPAPVNEIRGDVHDSTVLLPAAASRWAVHWAQNPEIDVLGDLFDRCQNGTNNFIIVASSSYSKARVWTMHTMRAVDLEQNGAPTEEQQRSRVSYMSVPYFLSVSSFTGYTTVQEACEQVVGLQIVGVEYLNEQNVLVTVLAAQPRHYNAREGRMQPGRPRTHRYYYLHPGRHDCVQTDAEDVLEDNPSIFSCWRPQSSGMWPTDDAISLHSGGGCARELLVPAFGLAVVMPLVAVVRMLETTLDAVCTLTAVMATHSHNPFQTLQELFTVELQQTTFHSMVDSAGQRLFHVDDVLEVAAWLSVFNARLLSFAVNALSGVVTGEQRVDKAVAGVRTLVVAGGKVAEGMPITAMPFAAVEKLFREPISYSGLHASAAVLTMADGVRQGLAMPALVRAFMQAQLALTSVFSLVLRVGRVVILRLLQTIGAAIDGEQAASSSIVSAALLESRAIIADDWLAVMRFQCYGFAQMVGSDKEWGLALRHTCLLLPDTLEGLMTTATVLALEYPVVACACKLGEGDALDTPLDTVVVFCLQRPMPMESQQWLLHVHFDRASMKDVCFAAMDSANMRLQHAFDRTYNRLFQATRHAAHVVDGLLALVTGDAVACDAFDASPYVLSIIPEPVDYFASCVHTDDCRSRCLDEYTGFEEEKRNIAAEYSDWSLGMLDTIPVPLESLLFALDDVQKGRHKPPFMILDAVEMPSPSCRVVCGQESSDVPINQCLLLAGQDLQNQLQVAYYCLPIDIRQYVFKWASLADSATFPSLPADANVREVYAATSWGPQQQMRDSVIAVIDYPETDDSFGSHYTVVSWCVPAFPPVEILRTHRLSRESFATGSSVGRWSNHLFKIDRVQVDVADSSENLVVVRAYGLHMDQTSADEPSRPTAACVQCSFDSDASIFVTSICASCESDLLADHTRVCLRTAASTQCEESIWFPTSRPPTPAGFVMQMPDVKATVHVMINKQRVSSKVSMPKASLDALVNTAENGAYMDANSGVHARLSILSSVAYPSEVDMRTLRAIVSDTTAAGVFLDFEFLTVNAQESEAAWLHVLAVTVDAKNVVATERNWKRANTQMHINISCSIDSCGACAQTTDGTPRLELLQLQNLCYAAQQCGVERCAGTLVNMRKPLCNLGNVLASQLHGIRILLQGLWGAVTDNVIMVVELTHERRTHYQLKWPEKLVRQEACTAKDTIVSFAATLTSVFGAVSHLMQDVSLHHGFVGSNVDSRVHARYIMLLTAITNMLSSMLLWFVYQGLVLQKFFSCTANEVLYQIDTIASNGGQPTMSIRFGDPAQDRAIANAGVAVCLAEDVRQSLQDAGVHVRKASEKKDAVALRVVRKISDAMSSSVDVGLSSYVQYAYHVYDIWLTWIASVLKAAMDVAQTADWENCKLPVVDTGLQSVGLCACNDEPHAIPLAEKQKKWGEHAFWCSGFLMLNEGDGSELLVWNPYSLDELLKMPSSAGGAYDAYLACLRGRADPSSPHYQTSCERYKQYDTVLSAQGVEVMQVISRCRANYQQSRWDEGSVMFALFSTEEWRNIPSLRFSASAAKDDKFTLMRKSVLQLLEHNALRQQQSLHLLQREWECLDNTLRAGVLQHDCHRPLTSFQYESVQNAQPHQVDACKVLAAGAERREFPRFLWSGNSRNHAPLAKLHPVVKTDTERHTEAGANLQILLKEVAKEFDDIMTAQFAQELMEEINVEVFSSEGDELHQLLDCVVMGPYSSADLVPNLYFDNLEPLPVPQYHRGNPNSRQFQSTSDTAGSEARQALVRHATNFMSEKADNATVAAVGQHLQDLASLWLDKENYQCICPTAERGFHCCSEFSDFKLRDTVMARESFDVHRKTELNLFQELVESSFLREKLWTDRVGTPVLLSAKQRSELHAAQLFAPSAHVPVRSYDVQDTQHALNTESLWETCTSSMAGMYASMPLTDEAENKERNAHESTVHVPRSVFEEFDPSLDYAEDRMHSMEILVDKLLQRARALTPHFWTHAHRYVPSDSVWCETKKESDALQEPATTTTPATFRQHKLRQEQVLAPSADELLYPADVLSSCVCGWSNENGCYIPDNVCVRAHAVLQQGEERARKLFERLCAPTHPRPVYRPADDLEMVLRVLVQLDLARTNCSARRPSIVWGLLSPAQQASWYANETQAWAVDLQHLATTGPAGLRLDMLSPVGESLHNYTENFPLGESLAGTWNAQHKHTIAQPVCSSSLREHLPDDLRAYFRDVFVPMAHSVQIVPAVEYCGRWVLEHAMWSALLRMAETPQEQLDRQQASALTWRGRCAAQLHTVALCELRGVYDIRHTAANASQCPAAGQEVRGCIIHYETSSCLLYCDSVFYDPCLCPDQQECSARAFNRDTCQAGLLHDARDLVRDDPVLLTSSLRWPDSIDETEAANDLHWQALQLALLDARQGSKQTDVDFQSIFNKTAELLLDREDEEDAPHSYCDDLFDYWPDVQHPVGYHPTTACSAHSSRTRGFDAWMSRDAAGVTLVDPVRMRDMTLASRVFGASHLVCDAHTYAAPGHRLNPYYMQSRWDKYTEADPAVPAHLRPPSIEDMNTFGTESKDETDTVFRGSGHSADNLLQHSVGLIRAWAQWHPPANCSTANCSTEAQSELDRKWPHWLEDEPGYYNGPREHGGFFLSSSEKASAGCKMPPLRRCRSDEHCHTNFSCLLNYNEDANTRRGICMRSDTCYQHEHCLPHKLCSGQGECVTPSIFVHNDYTSDTEIQFFGQSCSVSMQRLSRFESVPDFAKANGMCSFRHWYHYQNTTAGARGFDNIKQMSDVVLLRTDEPEPASLQRLKVLRTESGDCDRDYAHTDFQACCDDGSFTSLLYTKDNVLSETKHVQAARTWQRLNDSWAVNFCDMQDAHEVSGFLHPYTASSLHSAARDIKRCIALGMCPATSFHIRGRAVEGRRVRVHSFNEDSENQVQQQNAARDYCGLDAQRCWGMGHLLGQDCAEVDKEQSNLCVVDELVLPLLRVIYAGLIDQKPRTSQELHTRREELRKDCRHAFEDETTFKDVFEQLTQPYAWSDTARRQTVLQHANNLIMYIFGTRGFGDLAGYLDHSKCAVRVATDLLANEARWAALTDRQGFSFYQTSSVDFADEIMPGSSLYLIDRRLPVSVNLRWLMQCVVLAADRDQGGAVPSFLALLNNGNLRDGSVDCANYGYQQKETQTLTLPRWLRKAQFLFTQLDGLQLNPMQFSTDVFSSIKQALAQLPVFDIPDLQCVAPVETWEVNGMSIFRNTEPLRSLHRYRNPALGLSTTTAATVDTTTVDSVKRIFADAGNTSIYEHVLAFLLNGTEAQWQWTVETPLSLHLLERDKVIQNVLEFNNQEVQLRQMYPMYEYINLQGDKLEQLYNSITDPLDLDSYTTDTATDQTFCKCSEEEKKAHLHCRREPEYSRRRLREPEYSLTAEVKCEGLRLLPCNAKGVTKLLDIRSQLHMPFLRQTELLYLVLLIFQYEIAYTASGGYTTLHKLRDPASAQVVDEMYAVPLPNKPALSMREAEQFNTFLDLHDSTQMKCPEKSLDYFQETNKRHKQLRKCADSLRENIGWQLPTEHVLMLRPQPQTLLDGFYLTHMQQPPPTFLYNLTHIHWTQASHTSLERVICHVDGEQMEVMAPFWAEYFDVASDDSVEQPALACDLERTSAESILMVYDTLCSSSVSSPSARACAEHPRYLEHLQQSLPSACTKQDGRVVLRRGMGALSNNERLCDLRDDARESTCTLAHGALNGNVGKRVEDLDTELDVTSRQTGFWQKTSKIFRGTETPSQLLTALALSKHDIAGHCLGFQLSEQGVLHLRVAGLHSACDSAQQRTAAPVQEWLRDIENDWAWDHAHAQALLDVEEKSASWRCPLHWLQQYHDDNSRHQARSPSSQRNSARFKHITGEHHYAHPTVLHAYRLRGLRAPRFLGDMLACVAAADDCHGYLDDALRGLLRQEQDSTDDHWRPVAYVPAAEPECQRVLDWPHDCGSTTPRFDQDPVGRCVLRT